MTDHTWLTAEELSKVLGVNHDTVLRLARQGAIPCVRLTARLVRFSAEDVQRHLVGTVSWGNPANAKSSDATATVGGTVKKPSKPKGKRRHA